MSRRDWGCCVCMPSLRTSSGSRTSQEVIDRGTRRENSGNSEHDASRSHGIGGERN